MQLETMFDFKFNFVKSNNHGMHIWMFVPFMKLKFFSSAFLLLIVWKIDYSYRTIFTAKKQEQKPAHAIAICFQFQWWKRKHEWYIRMEIAALTISS